MARARESLQRRVLFYQVFRGGEPVRSSRDFDFANTFARIGALPNTLAGRRERESDEATLSCFVDSANTIRFGRIRGRNLPSRIDDGDTIDNIPLRPNGGLFEVTHLMYFDPGIIGAEFNFYAPRVSRLASYVRAKAAINNLEIVPIIRGDAIRDLRRMERIKRVSFKVATDAFPARGRQQFQIFNRIAAAAESPGVETISITLAAEQGRNSPSLGREIVNELLGLAALPNLGELADHATAEGYRRDSTRLELVDLLNDELVGKRDFIRENIRSKTLDSAHAYATISDVFRELEPRSFIQR